MAIRGDLLDRTARQVGRDGDTIHDLAGEPETTPLGRWYQTKCGESLLGSKGAFLTTREATCPVCRPPGRTR